MFTVVSVFEALNTISVYSKLEAFGQAAVVRTFAVAHVVSDLYQMHNINEHSGSNFGCKVAHKGPVPWWYPCLYDALPAVLVYICSIRQRSTRTLFLYFIATRKTNFPHNKPSYPKIWYIWILYKSMPLFYNLCNSLESRVSRPNALWIS